MDVRVMLSFAGGLGVEMVVRWRGQEVRFGEGELVEVEKVVADAEWLGDRMVGFA